VAKLAIAVLKSCRDTGTDSSRPAAADNPLRRKVLPPFALTIFLPNLQVALPPPRSLDTTTEPLARHVGQPFRRGLVSFPDQMVDGQGFWTTIGYLYDKSIYNLKKIYVLKNLYA
jgi:hypothetical protein